MNVLIPTYLDKFKCIGSLCEDTCCIGWDVYVDQNAYKKYKKSKSKKLKNLFDSNIKRNKKVKDFQAYAKIIMVDDKRCPFLNQENLCDIFIECGEDYLCNTCTYYPRAFSKIDNFIEIGLTTSCPEVARIALLNKNKMDFETKDIFVDKNIKIDFELRDYKNYEQELFWDLRNFSIDIVQNRNYEMDERLAILGISLAGLSNLMNNKDHNQIEQKLKGYKYMIDNMEFKKDFRNMDLRKDMQLKVLKELSELRVNNAYKMKYNKYFKKSLEILNYGQSDEENLNNYIDAYENYYKKFMEDKSYILENYIVNNMFNTKFPYSIQNKTNLFRNFIALMIKYFIIKFNLISLSKYYKEEFDEEKIVKIIQGISKYVDHADGFIEDVINLLEKYNLSTPAHMMIFIKD
ncbi:MAG: flagellin lysine-N-methylase [Peptostreptococcaceae bacterium]|jgi:lysine-N-methylase|nr:flagellin lysine-N-methylase [Peptostreptococcaceae bacterium]